MCVRQETAKVGTLPLNMYPRLLSTRKNGSLHQLKEYNNLKFQEKREEEARLHRGTQEEGGEQVFGSTALALKSARIVDLCCESHGFADFENTVDQL